MTNKPKKEPIAIINGGIDMWQKKGGGHITRKTKGRVVYGKPKTNKCNHNWKKRKGDMGEYCTKCGAIKGSGHLMITKTNKWVKKACFVLQEAIRDLATHHTNKELRSIKIKNWDKFDEIITQTQQETLEMSRKIVTKRLEIWKENHIAEMADSDSVEWAIYNLVSDIDFDLMKQCQTIKQRKEEL